MSGYNKIVPSIVQSSIWNEDSDIRIVWITLLALKDMDGIVKGNPQSLARLANVPQEKVDEALKIFTSPDPFSTTPDNDGRRIEVLQGGFKVLNHEVYREAGMSEARKEYWRDYYHKKRKTKGKETPSKKTQSKVSETQSDSKQTPRVPVSDSVSVSVSEGESERDADYRRLTETIGVPLKKETWLQIRRCHPGADVKAILDFLALKVSEEGGVKIENPYSYLMRCFQKSEAERIQRGEIGAKSGKPIKDRDDADFERRGATINMTPEQRQAHIAKEAY